MEEIEISTDPNRLNIEFIAEFISESYWAKGRTSGNMQTCIDNSLNFGVYLADKQIGFARVVSDFGHFAYIMDLFIHESFRGKAYSKKLMGYIMEYDKLQNIKIWRLATADAHGLYRQFGFKPLAQPENLMECLK